MHLRGEIGKWVWKIAAHYATNMRARGMRVSLPRTRFNLSLRGSSAHPELVEGRDNLDEAEHMSANRRCYGDEIATPRIKYGVAMTKWVRMSTLLR